MSRGGQGVGNHLEPREKWEPPPPPHPGVRGEPGPELSRKMEGLRGGGAMEHAEQCVSSCRLQAPPRVSSEVAISAAACKINVIGIVLQFDLSTGFN